MRAVLALCGVVAVGCSGGPSADAVDEGCGPNAPAYTTLDVVDDGETATIGGSEKRVVTVSAQTTDEDGDLHDYFLEIYVDGFIDGNLAPDPTFEVEGSAGTDDSCVVTDALVGAYIPFGDGSERTFGETVEIGVIVYDAAGNPSHSDPPIVEFTFPAQ